MANIIRGYQPGYVRLPNETVRDLRLSLETIGLLAYMLSHNENFVFNTETLKQRFKLGRDTFRRMLKELKDAGYLQMKARHAKDGTFAGQEWFIFDSPYDGSTVRLNNRQTVNQEDNKKEQLDKKEQEIQERTTPPAREEQHFIHSEREIYETFAPDPEGEPHEIATGECEAVALFETMLKTQLATHQKTIVQVKVTDLETWKHRLEINLANNRTDNEARRMCGYIISDYEKDLRQKQNETNRRSYPTQQNNDTPLRYNPWAGKEVI